MKANTGRHLALAVGGLLGLDITGTVRAGDTIGVEVRLTVGTDPAPACGTEAAIEVVVGTPVNYCFTVTNTGSVPLLKHSLGSDVFTLPDPFVQTLIDLPIAPGATAQYNLTVIPGGDNDRTYHWTAYSATPSYAVDTAAAFDTVALDGSAIVVPPGYSGVVRLPFDVTLYGKHFPAGGIDSLCVFRNGATQFVPQQSYCGGDIPPVMAGENWDPPPPDANDALVAHWNGAGTQGLLAYAVVGTAPNRRFVVDWHNVSSEFDQLVGIPCAAPDPADCGVSFQMLVDEADGSITYSYRDVTYDGDGGDLYGQDNGGSASVGLIDTTRHLRQIVANQQHLSAGQSIRYTPLHRSATAFTQARVNAGNPDLRIAPGSLAGRALIGSGPIVQPLTLRNLGTMPLDWDLTERASKSHFPLPGAGEVTSDNAPLPPLLQRPAPKGDDEASVPAYAVMRNAIDGAPYRRIDARSPGNTALVRQLSWDVFVGDFVDDDFSRHVMLMDTSRANTGVNYDWGFGHLDTATGELHPRGAAYTQDGDGYWRGLAWDRSNHTLYALASTCPEWPGQHATLYSLDPQTGNATRIARVDPGVNACFSDIAVSPAGALYAVDVLGNQLYAIDKATGEAQAIGPVGFDIGDEDRPQLDFDDQTGVLYIAAENPAMSPQRVGMYTLDTTTGLATYIGPFVYSTQSFMTPYGLAIAKPGPECLVPGDTPWLSVDGDSGRIGAGDEILLAVTLDPAGLAPGRHDAELCVASNDRAAPLKRVPVQFTVAEPAIFGDGFDGVAP